MTADQDTAFGTLQNGSLVLQRWLPGPAERIWRYLTDGDLRRKWLAAGDLPAAPGGTFDLVWRNDDLSGPGDPRPEGFAEVQTMTSRLLAIEPGRLMAIAWGEGTVTVTLESRGDRVLLTLTHSGLGEGPALTMIAAGWHMHIDILAAETAGTVAPSFWSGWAALRAAYGRRLPA